MGRNRTKTTYIDAKWKNDGDKLTEVNDWAEREKNGQTDLEKRRAIILWIGPFRKSNSGFSALKARRMFSPFLTTTSSSKFEADLPHHNCSCVYVSDHNFTFTTLGAEGVSGPTDTSGYQNTTLEGKVQLEGRGVQIWTVPIDGNYSIEAMGASGGAGYKSAGGKSWRTGGLGARVEGKFYFSLGAKLNILVGQTGKTGNVGAPLPGGGGGGSFVTTSDNKPLIVAGGGGGGGPPGGGFAAGDPGQSGENGSQNGGTGGSGGRVLDQGDPSATLEAGAGGGVRGDGKGGIIVTGGQSFVKGGVGGSSMSGGDGGFGGGGAAGHYAGGGGGYSGGGVTKDSFGTTAGGGGSFNGGRSPVAKAGENQGDGSVRIVLVRPDSLPWSEARNSSIKLQLSSSTAESAEGSFELES